MNTPGTPPVEAKRIETEGPWALFKLAAQALAELNLMLLPKLRDLVSDKKLSKGVSRLTKPMCLELLQKHQLTCRLQMLVKTENELIDRAFNNTLERVDFAIKILTDHP